jgi:hypothetical protein
MESYYSAQEMADMRFMYGCANGNSQDERCLKQNIIHNVEFHPTNYTPKFCQQLSKSWSFVPRVSIMDGLDHFEFPIWKFVY